MYFALSQTQFVNYTGQCNFDSCPSGYSLYETKCDTNAFTCYKFCKER